MFLINPYRIVFWENQIDFFIPIYNCWYVKIKNIIVYLKNILVAFVVLFVTLLLQVKFT